MGVILAIIGISVLILVHELGHLIAARKSGVHVHEFGIGFPPRALILGRRKGTIYSLNFIPFGGFVRLSGEGADDIDTTGRFDQATRWNQAKILAAGPLMNIAAGMVLTFAGLLVGTLVSVDTSAGMPEGAGTYIVGTLPGSPADLANLELGMHIVGITNRSESLRDPSTDQISSFIQSSPAGEAITLTVQTNRQQETILVTPTLLESGNQGIGISLDTLAVQRPSVWRAATTAVTTMPAQMWSIASGLFHFFGNIFSGEMWTQVSGPVGIVQVASQSSAIGIGVFFLFLAFLSYNLAVLNLLPVPALDGGRLVIVAIEAIRRKPLNPRAVVIVNTVAFLLLITLMVAVTGQDIWRLFK
jgi:regulator of sigma E protease